MKVVFLCRPDLLSKPGGDTVQIACTQQELEAMGVVVTRLSADDSRHDDVLFSADLVHGFNLLLAFQFESFITRVRDAGIPLVLSPIYWDVVPYERRSGVVPAWKKWSMVLASHLPGTVRFMEQHAKSVAYNRTYRRSLQRMLGRFDMLLPNSRAEAEVLREGYGATTAMEIVTNACRDIHFDAVTDRRARERFVLCAARIEHRKNQHALIRAMEGLNLPLHLAGAINRQEGGYWERCCEEARQRRVTVIHHETLAFPELLSLYLRARVHAQPSWFETPGLSSLEAAAAGCPILCTSVGSAREYFGNFARYCDPESVDSIRTALITELEDDGSTAMLADMVRRRCTWSEAARQTLAAYETLMRKR